MFRTEMSVLKKPVPLPPLHLAPTGKDEGAGECRSVGARCGLAVEGDTVPGGAKDQVAGPRAEDPARHGHAVLNQRHRDTPLRYASDELPGAV